MIPLRQLQVLIGLASSKTVKELALELDLSPKTIEYHRAQLCRRLRIFDIAGLTRYAIIHRHITLATPPQPHHPRHD